MRVEQILLISEINFGSLPYKASFESTKVRMKFQNHDSYTGNNAYNNTSQS